MQNVRLFVNRAKCSKKYCQDEELLDFLIYLIKNYHYVCRDLVFAVSPWRTNIVSFFNPLTEAVVQMYSVKRCCVRNFAKFIGKHLRQILFLKKRLWHRCFPVNIANFLRRTFFLKHLRRQVLFWAAFSRN